MNLIGIAGPARSGKDTVANILRDEYGYQIDAFAKPIKDTIRSLFALSARHIEGDLKETPLPGWGKSPRYLMQTFGTEWGRNLVDPSIWVTHAGYRWQDLQSREAANDYHRRHCDRPAPRSVRGMILTDVRFENEADWIRKAGGTIVHVFRPNAPKVEAHSSEAGIVSRKRDLSIANDSDLDELREHVITTHYYLEEQQAA